jgi:hypothetical protein
MFRRRGAAVLVVVPAWNMPVSEVYVVGAGVPVQVTAVAELELLQ